jgi:hypothetical protein
MSMTKTLLPALLAGSGLLLGASQATAEVFGGVDFPQGAISFADTLVSYLPGPGGVSAPHAGAGNALGPPDDPGGGAFCASQATCPYVSLGVGGAIVLGFTDNVLTGSGSDALDLWVFEVGGDVEDTTVEISVNGLTWLSVGLVTGGTRGVDLDAFGYGTSSAFSFVRLTDVAAEGEQSGTTVGADIDSVGAISTRAAVPEPTTWALMLLGFASLGSALRRARRDGALA